MYVTFGFFTGHSSVESPFFAEYFLGSASLKSGSSVLAVSTIVTGILSFCPTLSVASEVRLLRLLSSSTVMSFVFAMRQNVSPFCTVYVSNFLCSVCVFLGELFFNCCSFGSFDVFLAVWESDVFFSEGLSDLLSRGLSPLSALATFCLPGKSHNVRLRLHWHL